MPKKSKSGKSRGDRTSRTRSRLKGSSPRGVRSRRGGGPSHPSPDISFPLRVGAIDIGSNAIRFLAVEFEAPDRMKTLRMDRAAVRLGHDVFLSGRLTREAMTAAVGALSSFRESMDELEVLHHRTIATSAVRESRNGQELVALVRRKTGLEIDLISGAEEARLVFLAARQKVPLGNERWIIVDLGGGSVEVSLVEEQGLLWTESHAIGSVRLLEELGRAGQEPGRLRDLLVEYVGTLGVRLAADRERISGVIATGGNIETIAKLAFPASEDNEIIRLPLARLRAIIERLSLLSYEQRIQELGLREDRADVILPAALVYERLCVLAGAEEMIVPFVGLKEGIVIDLMDELVSHRAHTDRQEREALAAAAALGRRYSFNESHGMHVARLAGSLFDQLAPLHGLGDAERRLLLAAAVLHDVGQYVSFQKHHKHTLYLISESDLPGFSSTEMRIMGNVARYHRRSEPSTRHEPFTRLKPAERRIVRKLGSILRLADALDSEKQQRVQRVEARMTDKKLSLRLEGSGELLLERWAVQKKRDFFTRVFGLEVELEA